MTFIFVSLISYGVFFGIGFVVFFMAGLSGDELPWRFKRVELFYPACWLGVRLGAWARSKGLAAWLWGSFGGDE